MPKRRQFSLRMLMIAMTLAALAVTPYAWAKARERKLVRLVEEFNVAMDDQRYDDALTLAKAAKAFAPRESVTDNMVWKAEFVQALQRGEQPAGGFWCY